jgi:hypothetical protein
MTKRSMSLLALGLSGVFGSAFACGDAPMSMKDASVSKPAEPVVVASASKTAPAQAAQTTQKASASTTATTVATTPANSSDKAATRH